MMMMTFLTRLVVLNRLSGMGWKIVGKEQCNFTIDHGFGSQKGKIRSLKEEYWTRKASPTAQTF
jgi:hypothetical protein